MKKICLFMAGLAAVGTLASCNKENLSNSHRGSAHVVINSGLSETKATGVTESEADGAKKINNLQVFVFTHSDGVLHSYKEVNGNTIDFTLNTTAEGVDYDFYVVANNKGLDATGGANIKDLKTKAEIEAAIADLKVNDLTSFIAFGTNTTKVINDVTVNIPLKRLVSMVEIKSISAAFANTVQKNQEFALLGLYLINAAGTERLNGASPTTMSWYNENAVIAGDADHLVSENLEGAPVILQTAAGVATAHTVKHDFFAYRNASSDHPTKLAIKTRLNGVVNWYTVDISKLCGVGGFQPNKAYIINSLTITGEGTDDPNKETVRKNVTFSLSIVDWETGFTQDVTI